MVPSAGFDPAFRAYRARALATSAHFPKSALHSRDTVSRTSESYGHSQTYDSSAAFDLKSLGSTRSTWCRDFRSAALDDKGKVVRLAGNDPAASAMSKRRSAYELKTRGTPSVDRTRSVSVCKTDALPLS